jgi:hypothetical protein
LSGNWTAGGDPADRAEVLAELAQIELQIDGLADQLVAAPSKTAARVIERAIEKLAVREEVARARLASLVPEVAPPTYADLLTADDWHERWVAGELTATELSDLRDMFGAYFAAIQVAPRVGKPADLDPKRIKVQWKGSR